MILYNPGAIQGLVNKSKIQLDLVSYMVPPSGYNCATCIVSGEVNYGSGGKHCGTCGTVFNSKNFTKAYQI